MNLSNILFGSKKKKRDLQPEATTLNLFGDSTGKLERNLTVLSALPEVSAVLDKKANVFSSGTLKLFENGVEKPLPLFWSINKKQSITALLKKLNLLQSIYGIGYLYFNNGIEDPTSVQNINNAGVQVTNDNKHEFEYKEYADNVRLFQYDNNGRSLVVPSNTIMPFLESGKGDWFHPISKLHELVHDINTVIAGNTALFSAMNKIGFGFLTPEVSDPLSSSFSLTDEDIEEMGRRFKRKNSVANSDIVLLPKAFKLQKFDFDAQTLRVEEAKNLLLKLTAIKFGVPYELFSPEKSKFDNQNLIYRQFIDATVTREATEFTSTLNRYYGFIGEGNGYVLDYSDSAFFRADEGGSVVNDGKGLQTNIND